MPAFPEFEYNFHGEKGLVNINPEHVGDITGHAPDQHGCVVTIRTRRGRTYPVVSLTREQVVAKLCLEGPGGWWRQTETVGQISRTHEWVRYSPTETAPTEPALKGVHLGSDGSLVAVTRDGSAVHTIDEGRTWVNTVNLHRLVLELLQDPNCPRAEYHQNLGHRMKPLRDMLGLTGKAGWSRDEDVLVFRHEGTELASVWPSAAGRFWWACGRGGWGTTPFEVKSEADGIAWVREDLAGIHSTPDPGCEAIVVPPVPPHLMTGFKQAVTEALTRVGGYSKPGDVLTPSKLAGRTLEEVAADIDDVPGQLASADPPEALAPLPVEWAGKPATDDEFELEQFPDDSLRMTCTIAGRRATCFSVDFGKSWVEGVRRPTAPALSINEGSDLLDVLVALDIAHEPLLGDDGNLTMDGRWSLSEREVTVYKGTVGDIWAWLRQSGRIA